MNTDGTSNENKKLDANEFNIRIEVNSKVYTDFDDNTDPKNPINGNLKGKPFADFGEAGSNLSAGLTFSIKVTPLFVCLRTEFSRDAILSKDYGSAVISFE